MQTLKRPKHVKSVIISLRVIAIGVIFLLFLHIYSGLQNLIDSNYEVWQQFIIALQIIFEFIVFMQMAFIILGVAVALDESTLQLSSHQLDIYPDLDVYIPIRDVNPKKLEKTLIALKENDYPQEKLHIFLADDTPPGDLVQTYKQLAKHYGIQHIHEPSNILFKAGMLNLALKHGSSQFVSFFDYDQIPQQGILKHFIEVLTQYSDASFVQAKKSFHGLTNLAKVWSALLYTQYFEIFQRTKERSQTVLFAGSTACFRRADLEKVGGIPEDTFTEDNGLSVLLLLYGKHGKYSPRVGSIGSVPDNFSGQISQLWRWSHGASHVLRNYSIRILKSPDIRFSQKFDLIGTLGIAPIVVLVYIYSGSFILLIITGVDTSRILLMGISSLIFVPLITAVTYAIVATSSVWLSSTDKVSEFKFKHLPGFLLIALSSNVLVFSSGISGLLGLLGPRSKKGQWNRKIPIYTIGVIGCVLGLILEYLAFTWYLDGYKSALLLIVIGFTLIPSLPISLYYRDKK
ncbi:MAG: glycosyltransferase [Candidatus Kariarchaeaceae archaeon]